MPFIDACMRELNATGYMPNRGRMVCACYLTMDLKQDWRFGIAYFESGFIDHDVHSNYVNWAIHGGLAPGKVNILHVIK